MNADFQIAVGTWALVGVTLLGGAAVIWGLLDGTKVRKEQVTLLRRRETVRMYTSTIDVRTQFDTRLPHDRDLGAVREYISASRHDSEKQLAIRHYLNYWESIAAAVKFDALDAELLKELVGGRLLAIWNNYGPYIVQRRATLNSPTLFIGLEGLAISWGARPLDLQTPTNGAAEDDASDGLGGEEE